MEIAVITQGATRDEVTRNLQEEVALHLDGEDLPALGLVKSPTLLAKIDSLTYSSLLYLLAARNDDGIPGTFTRSPVSITLPPRTRYRRSSRSG